MKNGILCAILIFVLFLGISSALRLKDNYTRYELNKGNLEITMLKKEGVSYQIELLEKKLKNGGDETDSDKDKFKSISIFSSEPSPEEDRVFEEGETEFETIEN